MDGLRGTLPVISMTKGPYRRFPPQGAKPGKKFVENAKPDVPENRGPW